MGFQQDLICTKGPNLALTTAGWRSRLSGLHGSFNAWIATPSTWSPGKIHHPWMSWYHVDVGANKAVWRMSPPPNRSRKHLFMGLTCVIFRHSSAISKMNQTHSSLQRQLLRQCPRRSHQPPWHWHLPRYDGIHTRGVPWSKSLEFASIQTRPHQKHMENMMKDRQTNRLNFDWIEKLIKPIYNSLSLDWKKREIHEYIAKQNNWLRFPSICFKAKSVMMKAQCLEKHSSSIPRNLSKPGPSLLSFRAQVAVIDPWRLQVVKVVMDLSNENTQGGADLCTPPNIRSRIWTLDPKTT